MQRIIINAVEFFKSLFGKRKRVVLRKSRIKLILPHRGRMLLLDKVTIFPEKIIGEFLVTKKTCKGHAVLGDKLVLRGSDLLDMAAQLLGVWVGQNSDFFGRICMVREYGGAKFKNPILPDEKLIIEIDSNNIKEEVLGKDSLETVIITGENFLIRTEKETKAQINSVKLVVLFK